MESNTNTLNGPAPSLLPRIPKLDLILAILAVPFSYFLILFSLALSVAIGGGIIVGLCYCMYGASRIPVKAVLAIIVIAITLLYFVLNSLVIVIKSFFKRASTFEVAIGIDINQPEYHELKSCIEEVCSSLKTKSPKNILLAFEPTFYVTQGRIITPSKKYRGRSLVVGVETLRILTRDEFKSIIAHEMGHFTGNDTTYSLYVLPLYRNIGQIRDSIGNYIQSEGAASLVVYPTYLILGGFYHLFELLDAKISRKREMRADFIAVYLYGQTTFRHALTKVTNISRIFGKRSTGEIKELISQGKSFVNYFEFFNKSMDSTDLENESENEDETQSLDRHCCNRERFAYLPDHDVEDTKQWFTMNHYEPAEKELTDLMTGFLYVLNNRR